jgi:S1-C subfamily serine protease
VARRKEEGTYECPQCGLRTRVLIPPGRSCADCESERAWTRYAKGRAPLVLSREELENAAALREGRIPFRVRLGNAGRILPGVLALLAGAVSIVLVIRLMRPWELGPLDEYQESVSRLGHAALILGILATFGALTALLFASRSRLYRSVSLLILNLAALLIGATGATLGGLHFAAARHGFGWQYTSMPPLGDASRFTPAIRALMEATAVVLAPNREGDARGLGVGTGAIIHATPRRAYIVTNSHVAMPYAAVGSFRDASKAHPVWVYLSDGRNGEGRVRWVAPPPLDVALVTIDLPNAPAPVRVAASTEAAGERTGVVVVPNPFREGWLYHRGQVLRRVEFDWPAGTYSIFHTDLPLLPGDSGSGLFDTSNLLLGLNTWGTLDPEDAQGLSLPAKAMRDIVARLEKGELVGDRK